MVFSVAEVLIDEMKTEALESAVAVQQQVWTARRQMLERRKRNIDAQLKIAVEKTDALEVLVGDVFSKSNARDRIRTLRWKLDEELRRWKFNEATQADFNRGYFSEKDRVVAPSASLIERMLMDQMKPVTAEAKEREAVKMVDLVAGGYEDSVMMYRLVVEHGEDVAEFVDEYRAELGLERL